ncbi:MAG: class I SAM-dependent methyltransferase, partial [Candidatus Rokuibacteriota bacterium]
MALANAQPHESRLYYEFSHLYDLIFRRVFYPRIRMVVRSLDIEPGARVLELGVGTGLSLDAYPLHCQLTGIDLAPDMLERAQDKVNRNGWRHVTLEPGDAQNLRFADDSFDYVMAFHVVSVVPDAARLIAEAQRVCRPGGVITVINHFRSPRPWLASITNRLD